MNLQFIHVCHGLTIKLLFQAVHFAPERLLNVGKKFGCSQTRFPFDSHGYADITRAVLSSAVVLLCDVLKLSYDPENQSR